MDQELLYQIGALVALCVKLYFYVHICALILSYMNVRKDTVLSYYLMRFTYPLWKFFFDRLPYALKIYHIFICLFSILLAELLLPKIIIILGSFVFFDATFYKTFVNLLYASIASVLEIMRSITGFILFISLIWLVTTLMREQLQQVFQFLRAYIAPILDAIEAKVIRTNNPLTLAFIFAALSLLVYILNSYLLTNLPYIFDTFFSLSEQTI